MDIIVHEGGKTSTVKIGCITCEGKGTINQEQKERLEAEKKLWCVCGNHSGESNFHDDYTRKICSKHHYTCKDCGKILQVG